MNLALPLVIAFVATTFATSVPANDRNDDVQGRWSIVAVPDGWKRIPGTNVVVTSDEVRICIGKFTTSKLKYKIDAARATVDSSRTVNGKCVIQLGTYRREGDTLTLSVGPEGKARPASPDCTREGAMRWVFKRP